MASSSIKKKHKFFKRIHPIRNFIGFFISLLSIASFSLLLMVFIIVKAVRKVFSIKFMPGFIKIPVIAVFDKLYSWSIKTLDNPSKKTIPKISLIELSIRNMKAKKTRTLVTVGGMSIGIAAIVFLVSIGYGLQNLVINRVARLDEMRQTEVVSQTGGKVKIDDKTLSDFSNLDGVEKVLPMIAAVGRVNYQNSVSDMAVYGVTSDFLNASAIKPSKGSIFESNEIALDSSFLPVKTSVDSTEKLGVYGKIFADVEFSLEAGAWIPVYADPSDESTLLGYTKRLDGQYYGEEAWGDSYLGSPAGSFGYTEDNEPLGKWVRADFLLWLKQSCDVSTTGDCEDGQYLVFRDASNAQVSKTGYIKESNLLVVPSNIPSSRVSAAETTAADVPTSAYDWVELESENDLKAVSNTKTVELPSDTEKMAVVNRSMLKILNIDEADAVGKTFSTSFIIVGELLENASEKIESVPATYTIVAVTPDEKTPIFYAPFIDLRSLGVNNYSQVKVVAENQGKLSTIRKQIEAMGYSTQSVSDTVAQINTLFSTARTVLALLGLVALSVASLGMFNTLTVSLLERIREVGLMKAMGMKSHEVKNLFLTESMIMGLFGGILGISMGYVAGKLFGLLLSAFSLSKGAGFIDIAYIPYFFVMAIIILSLFVGVITGIYPAKRATKISALNALRYE